MNLVALASKVSNDLAASLRYIPDAPAAMVYCRHAIEKIVNYQLQVNFKRDYSPHKLASNISRLKEVLPSAVTTKLFKLNESIKPHLHDNPTKISDKGIKTIIYDIVLVFKEMFSMSLKIPKQLPVSDVYDLDKEYAKQIIDDQGIDFTASKKGNDFDRTKLEHASIHIDKIKSAGRELTVDELLEYGIVKAGLGRYDMSDTYFRQALEISKQDNDCQSMSYAISNLSINASEKGEFREAFELEKASYSICVENNLYSSQCGSLINLGCLNLEAGNYDSAEDYFNSALQLSKDLKDDEKQVAALTNLGVLFQTLNLIDDSDYCLLEAEKIVANYDSDSTIRDRASLLFNKAYNLSEKEEFDKAVDAYQESMELAISVNNIIMEARILNNIAQIKIEQQEYVEAEKCIKLSLEIYRETGHKRGEAESLGNLAKIIYFGEQNHELAIEYLTDSLDIDRKIGNKLGQAKTLNNLRIVFSEKGDKTGAEKYQRYRDEILEQIGLDIEDI